MYGKLIFRIYVLYVRSYAIMRKCWKSLPEDRPTFKELSSLLDARLQSIAGYMELKMFLEPQGISLIIS